MGYISIDLFSCISLSSSIKCIFLYIYSLIGRSHGYSKKQHLLQVYPTMINAMGMNMTTSMTYYYEAVRASIIYLWDWFFYEILTFCTFSIIRNHAALGELIKLYTNSTSIIKITTASVISFGIIQCLRFIISLRSESSSSAGFSMKPMLFPSQTFHTRFFPEKHSFKYSYLLVGIPIGWKGSIGGILSVDTGKEISPWYRRLLSMKTGGAWYTVNGDDYLERGHVEGGLRGKLDAYLISQVYIFEPAILYISN